MWVADSMETLPWGTKVAFCGIAKLCFVGIQKYMLNECVYFHQWHTRAARSAQGYQFINFYSGLRCPLNSNLSCRWSGISCFHLLKFKQFGYKEICPNKIWPHLPGVYVSQVLILQCPSFTYTFRVYELKRHECTYCKLSSPHFMEFFGEFLSIFRLIEKENCFFCLFLRFLLANLRKQKATVWKPGKANWKDFVFLWWNPSYRVVFFCVFFFFFFYTF